mgnify:CR=1 FL=1
MKYAVRNIQTFQLCHGCAVFHSKCFHHAVLHDMIKVIECGYIYCQPVEIIMHHVKSLKALTGKDIYEQKMLQIRRKSLALCEECFNKCCIIVLLYQLLWAAFSLSEIW